MGKIIERLILSIGKNFWYEVAKKGDSPKSASDYLSAIYDNQMIALDPTYSQQTIQDMKQIYSFNLGLK